VLLVTGLPPVLGWLVGVGLLLWSPLWSGWQKALGILVWPGGYVTLLAFGVMSSGSCSSRPVPAREVRGCVTSGPPMWTFVALAVAVIAPLVVAAYLYRAAGRRSDS
jgi:hypothetical protein